MIKRLGSVWSRLIEWLLILSVVAFTQATHAAANTVIAARVWPAQDYTRITLEVSNPIVYKMSVLKNPDRIVIDVEQTELNAALKSLSDKILASDPYINQLRVAQFKPGIVRLVVDLKTEVKPTIFTLSPVGTYKHRLVLDIYPVKDLLMAMLAERDGVVRPAEKEAPVQTDPPASVTTEPLPPQLVTQQPAEVLPGAAPAESENKPIDTVQQPQQAVQDNVKALEKSQTTAETTAPKHSISTQPDNNLVRKITIALDPGHGGEDPGAIGAIGSHEKDITLMLAKKLKAKIDEEPNMRAVLTRDADYFIALHGRVLKARKLQADLFISIHADAFTNPAAHGSSVFALSEKGATSASARYLAKKENESDLIGGVSLNVKDPFLARTLLDLSQTAAISDSLKLGKAVLGQIGKINKLHKNHVEQAGFAVLKSPDIPSILVETAFISNPDEERRLNDDAYQDKLVMSILEGIKRYFSTNPALAKTKVALE